MVTKKLGTIYTVRAKLYDNDGIKIGTCIDTPNAIAKAIMEHPEISIVDSINGLQVSGTYHERMKSWNVAASGYQGL